jgi:DNA-binding transcriptional regulator YhcF (GntR family)
MSISPDQVFAAIIGFVKTRNRYPTIRELSAETGAHYTTINRKIKKLKEEGRITTIPRGGSGISLPEPKRPIA